MATPNDAPTNGAANGVPVPPIVPHQPTVTILVTGFGPFQDRFPVNPSFEITRLLPPTLLTARGVHVNIIPYAHAIRVCYDEVRNLVPVIHESHAATVDMVLHIGMASGRDYYTCEVQGHRDGYGKNKDLDGKVLPADHGTVFFPDCPAALTTSLDVDGVLDEWRQSFTRCLPPGLPPGVDAECCRLSEDAGHYLCDYIYFNSLAWFGRRNLAMMASQGEVAHRPVLFLHVPAESDAGMLEKGRAVALALIEAMAEGWAKGAKGVVGV